MQKHLEALYWLLQLPRHKIKKHFNPVEFEVLTVKAGRRVGQVRSDVGVNLLDQLKSDVVR